jgi:hypothetical protein
MGGILGLVSMSSKYHCFNSTLHSSAFLNVRLISFNLDDDLPFGISYIN